MKAMCLLAAALVVAALPISAAAAEAPPGATSCSGCHAGRDVDSAIPRLTGRGAADIVAQMQAFRSGQRPATVMDQIAKGYSDAEVQAIAAWYADQK